MKSTSAPIEPLESRIAPATFTVTTVADSGPGSLRQALLEANATTDADIIAFAIAGAGVHTIVPTTALPPITASLTIDGTTQAGSVAGGAPLIELSGTGLPAGTHGLEVQAAGTRLVALTINRFPGSGIVLASTGGAVERSFIGTDALGSGGGAPGNGTGITITGRDNVIGGLTAGVANAISGNLGPGIVLSGTGADENLVSQNAIGLTADLTAALPNAVGILIQNGAGGNVIGGAFEGLANDIAGNLGAGIAIVNPALSPGNALLSNRIASNGGLGIDLFNDGVTANVGAHQFYPLLTEALTGGGRTLIRGSLTMSGAPSSSFQVQFFGSTQPDPTSFGEGRLFLGSASVTTDAAGVASFSVPALGIVNGNFVTATALDAAGNTSEFSSAVAITVGTRQASISTDGRTATFTDADGDLVTLRTNRGRLSQGNIALTAAGPGSGVQFLALNLSGDPDFAGASITLTARRSALGGDGFVNLGHLNAQGVNLGAVRIVGDLGRIDAGSGVTGAVALTSLSVQSMGRYLGQTEILGSSPDSVLDGAVGTIAIAGNFIGKALVIDGNAAALSIGRSLIGFDNTAPGVIVVNGTLGRAAIGGDITGGTADDTGRLTALGIRELTIGGSVISGSGDFTGSVGTGTGGIGRLTLRGSLIGHSTATGADGAGAITTDGRIGSASIGGSMLGGASAQSGFLFGASLGTIVVGGSLKGGTGSDSGTIATAGAFDSAVIRGSLFGGAGSRSGALFAGTAFGRVAVGGSLRGAAGTASASIESGGALGSVSIGGDAFGGTGAVSAAITATDRIGSVAIVGSLFSSVVTNSTLGSITIGGDHFGLISARGTLAPATAAGALAIGRIAIAGDLSGAIFAGLDWTTQLWTNPDTLIGPITIGGDVSGASVSAGIAPGANGSYADSDDTPVPGGTLAVRSQIASILVRGMIGRGDSGQHFGFTAQHIGRLQVGATVFPLTAGADRFDLGILGNISLREA